ncbi:MAG: hypothetical protein J3K34DRAFT_377349 [Monoraphidium minutum]|nr:MAG: hypothetical protein J3K34DRAFT_377349 [Monoraphidium minutum]
MISRAFTGRGQSAASLAAPVASRVSPLVPRLSSSRGVCVHGLKENIAALAPIDAVAAVTVTLPDGAPWAIPNAPGKAASARIFAHLASKHGGVLTAAAAEEGLALYGEFTEEARQQPGSHPNIDLLFRVVQERLECAVAVEERR